MVEGIGKHGEGWEGSLFQFCYTLGSCRCRVVFKVVCDFVAGWMGWNLHCCRRRLLSYYLPFVSSLSPYPYSVFWVHVVFSLVSLS